MKPKFQIGDRFVDPDDGAIGTIIEAYNDSFRIKWPCLFDDAMYIWYYEEEILDEMQEGAIMKVISPNQIWKELNNEI